MLRKISKILLSFVLMLSCVCINDKCYNKINATDQSVETEYIPVKMEPYSKIYFIDDEHYIIIEGGLVDDESEYSRHGMPKPKQGLTVIYASDGFILKTLYPEGIENPYNDLEVDEYLIQPLYPVYVGFDLVAQWGPSCNYLYQSETGTDMMGRGRATTFSHLEDPPSVYGCYDNRLKKGDIAVKEIWDNCPNGGTVQVNAQKRTGGYLTKTMIMGDHGDMPDAIVDIWYNGVEYWGYTYSLYLSLPGTATITYTGTRRFTPIGG